MCLILTRVYFVTDLGSTLSDRLLNSFLLFCCTSVISLVTLIRWYRVINTSSYWGFCVLTASLLFSAVLQLGWGLVGLWLRQDIKPSNQISRLAVGFLFCM